MAQARMPMPAEFSDRDWRADPTDGLRPLVHIRSSWTNAYNATTCSYSLRWISSIRMGYVYRCLV